ncbi:hypothetical protein QUH18_27630, partial [Klebsiella pneumoniae]|uniref:hypothetical protein n=1 Tax=Klebsiella pneumoniae TaxID=573 RepID=UPI003B1283E5|nr:hypothetical protein [Klebsiella pneumoniae]
RLGEAAKMEAATAQVSVNGWLYIPVSGNRKILVQWLVLTSPTIDISGGEIDIMSFSWPIAFPSGVLAVSNSANTYVQAVRSIEGANRLGGKLLVMSHSGNVAHTPVTSIIAIGY